LEKILSLRVDRPGGEERLPIKEEGRNRGEVEGGKREGSEEAWGFMALTIYIDWGSKTTAR